jgi:hypothetical protein
VHSSPQVAIVHLARCVNGDAALQDFLRSYCELSPGIEHDLVVVLKGYEQDPRSKEFALEALRPHRALTVAIADEGFDLDAYRTAVNTFNYSYYCFVNSFSRPTCEGWLRQMMHWAQEPRVGIVGATGSYQSVPSDELDDLLKVFVRHLGKLRKSPLAARIVDETPTDDHSRESFRWTRAWLMGLLNFYVRHLCRWMNLLRLFAAFPNAHIRTNGFVLSRQVISRMKWPPTATKFDAYLLESGRRGVTAQVLRMGLEAVVVGRNGRGYLCKEWHGSGTFWQGNQDNLLVCDNQTRDYELGSPDRRRYLCRHAWRHLATPNFQ